MLNPDREKMRAYLVFLSNAIKNEERDHPNGSTGERIRVPDQLTLELDATWDELDGYED